MSKLEDQFERLKVKSEHLTDDISEIRKGLRALLDPSFKELRIYAELTQKLRWKGSKKLLLEPFLKKIGGKTLPVFLVSNSKSRDSQIFKDEEFYILLEEPFFSSKWGETGKDLKWLATHIYEICDALKSVIEEIAKTLKEVMDKMEKQVDEERDFLAPQTILQRMKGGEK